MPSVWAWAAQSLTLEAPALFDGCFGADQLGAPVSPTQYAREPLGAPSKPPSPSPEATSSIQEDLANRRRHPPTQLGFQDYLLAPTPPPTQPSRPQPRGGHREVSPKKAPSATCGRDAHLEVPTSTAPNRLNSPARTPRTTPEEDARERASRLRSAQRHLSSSRGQSSASSKPNPKFFSGWRNGWKSDWGE